MSTEGPAKPIDEPLLKGAKHTEDINPDNKQEEQKKDVDFSDEGKNLQSHNGKLLATKICTPYLNCVL